MLVRLYELGLSESYDCDIAGHTKNQDLLVQLVEDYKDTKESWVMYYVLKNISLKNTDAIETLINYEGPAPYGEALASKLRNSQKWLVKCYDSPVDDVRKAALSYTNDVDILLDHFDNDPYEYARISCMYRLAELAREDRDLADMLVDELQYSDNPLADELLDKIS